MARIVHAAGGVGGAGLVAQCLRARGEVAGGGEGVDAFAGLAPVPRDGEEGGGELLGRDMAADHGFKEARDQRHRALLLRSDAGEVADQGALLALGHREVARQAVHQQAQLAQFGLDGLHSRAQRAGIAGQRRDGLADGGRLLPQRGEAGDVEGDLDAGLVLQGFADQRAIDVAPRGATLGLAEEAGAEIGRGVAGAGNQFVPGGSLHGGDAGAGGLGGVAAAEQGVEGAFHFRHQRRVLHHRHARAEADLVAQPRMGAAYEEWRDGAAVVVAVGLFPALIVAEEVEVGAQLDQAEGAFQVVVRGDLARIATKFGADVFQYLGGALAEEGAQHFVRRAGHALRRLDAESTQHARDDRNRHPIPLLVQRYLSGTVLSPRSGGLPKKGGGTGEFSPPLFRPVLPHAA